MNEEEVRSIIAKIYKETFEIEIPKDHLNTLYAEYERIRDDLVVKGLPKENAEQIALETIKAGIKLGKVRLERGGF